MNVSPQHPFSLSPPTLCLSVTSPTPSSSCLGGSYDENNWATMARSKARHRLWRLGLPPLLPVECGCDGPIHGASPFVAPWATPSLARRMRLRWPDPRRVTTQRPGARSAAQRRRPEKAAHAAPPSDAAQRRGARAAPPSDAAQRRQHTQLRSATPPRDGEHTQLRFAARG